MWLPEQLAARAAVLPARRVQKADLMRRCVCPAILPGLNAGMCASCGSKHWPKLSYMFKWHVRPAMLQLSLHQLPSQGKTASQARKAAIPR